MSYVVIVDEPWLGEGYSAYDAEGFAEAEEVPVETWLEVLREGTQEKGGRIVYEGPRDDCPQNIQHKIARRQEANRK